VTITIASPGKPPTCTSRTPPTTDGWTTPHATSQLFISATQERGTRNEMLDERDDDRAGRRRCRVTQQRPAHSLTGD
jgi:hypothetical protein